jgi:predicted DNA-binding transcriptional regulator YafY
MRSSRKLVNFWSYRYMLLQNRGRLTSQALAVELEVAPRTILRDMDAITVAGLPIVTFQGNRGGFELGFNYRTRLTGLDEDEAEALGVWLSDLPPSLRVLGMCDAGARASRKLLESFPDAVRDNIRVARDRFRITPRAKIAAARE